MNEFRGKKAVFFAKVADLETLERVEFYAQDIRILHELGLEVEIARSFSQLRRADVYFVWWWTYAFGPTAFAGLLRRPVVVTGTFDIELFPNRPVYQKLLMRYALRNAAANLFVSQNEFTKIPEQMRVARPIYSPHTVDTTRYAPGGEQRERFAFMVARLNEGSIQRKGVYDVLEAARIIESTHPDVRFIIAGDQETGFSDLAARAREMGLAEKVVFPGAIPAAEKIRLMQRCGVYLQPSYHEGFGVAMLEAMSCGAPVVTCPVGAIPEVVGECADLVPPGNPEAIAAAVRRILNEPELQARRSAESRTRAVTLFPHERRRDEIRALFSSLL